MPTQSFKRIDDPVLIVEYACERDRNNVLAARAGLPPIGATLINEHGIQWTVFRHGYACTYETLGRWREGNGELIEDLFPAVAPQNLSERFSAFFGAIDKCTSKGFLFLDTMPGFRKGAFVPHGHQIDTASCPTVNHVFIDAARIHETILAHEMGHAWVEYVDEFEDHRVLKSVENPQLSHQLSRFQSFVLDFRVNDVIRQRGFDMAPIEGDEATSISSLGQAIDLGYRPEHRREEAFIAELLAMQMLNRDCNRGMPLAKIDDTLEKVVAINPDLAKLGHSLAEVIRRNGYDSKQGILRSIDECLLLAFEYTGDSLDLDNDLVLLQPEEPDFDKYPTWLEGTSVKFKREVGRKMAKEDIPSKNRWTLAPTPDNKCLVSFEFEGDRWGPWQFDEPYPRPAIDLDMINVMNRRSSERATHLPDSSHPTSNPFQPRQAVDPNHIIEMNRLNRERLMNPSSPSSAHNSHFPPIPGQPGRSYTAGLGRWLTQVRLEELLAGERPYSYANCNPVTYTDPSGLTPCSPPDPCKNYPHDPGFWDNPSFKNAVSKAIQAGGCAGFDPTYLAGLLTCIVEAESRDRPGGYSFPTKGGGVQGPCQIWPGSDKDKLCGKGWRNSLQEHMTCCALILCQY